MTSSRSYTRYSVPGLGGLNRFLTHLQLSSCHTLLTSLPSEMRAPLNWYRLFNGQWIYYATGTFGILPFPVSSYIGDGSDIRLPHRGTYRMYFEWVVEWQGLELEPGRTLGPALDDIGSGNC